MKELIIEKRLTFKKEEKLKSQKLIDLLFKEGISFSNFPFRVLYIFLEKNNAPLQSGFAVSTKHFKKAIERNRIKRLMREAYRMQNNNLTESLKNSAQFLAVFFIYTGNLIPEHQDVTDKMQNAIKRLNKIVDEAIAAHT